MGSILSIFKSGSISDFELKEYIKDTGYQPTEEELDQLLQELKMDRGPIARSHTVDDFINLLYKRMSETDIDYEFVEAFKIFDKNSTGAIPINELKNTIVNDNLEDTFNAQQIEELLNLADTKKDGYIHYESFISELLKKKDKNDT